MSIRIRMYRRTEMVNAEIEKVCAFEKHDILREKKKDDDRMIENFV